MEWFKHDSNANLDEKLQEVLLDYGLEGYGLYWYCIELIVNKTSKDNTTFEIRHDARVIARSTGSTVQKVEEMMKRFIDIGLFENNADGKVTCLKIAKRLMMSQTNSKGMRSFIQDVKKQHDTSLDTKYRDDVMTCCDDVTPEENRREENRIEEKRAEKTEKHEGSRLSLLWIIPNEYLEYCKTERPDLNPKLVAESFKDFWIGKTGADAIKNDWFVAWRKWVRNERVIINNQSSSNAWRSDLNSIYNKAKELNLNTQGKTKGELLAMIDKRNAN